MIVAPCIYETLVVNVLRILALKISWNLIGFIQLNYPKLLWVIILDKSAHGKTSTVSPHINLIVPARFMRAPKILFIKNIVIFPCNVLNVRF